MSKISGRLEPFFETGADGIIWSVQNPKLPGYEGLNPIQDGDALNIIAENGKCIWSSVVIPDKETGWILYPWGDELAGQQSIDGNWVRWTQRDMDPHKWLSMFENRLRVNLYSNNIKENNIGLEKDIDVLYAISNMNESTKYKLFDEYLYSWFSWYSNNHGYSVAENIGLTIPQVISSLGNQSNDLILIYKQSNRKDIISSLYSDDLLFKIIGMHRAYGNIMLLSGTKELRAETTFKIIPKLKYSPLDFFTNNEIFIWDLVNYLEGMVNIM